MVCPRVPKFDLDSDVPLQACLVHNAETIRVKFFIDLLVESKFPLMLIGLAGSGGRLKSKSIRITKFYN